jgi:hypothetical protein
MVISLKEMIQILPTSLFLLSCWLGSSCLGS